MKKTQKIRNFTYESYFNVNEKVSFSSCFAASFVFKWSFIEEIRLFSMKI